MNCNVLFLTSKPSKVPKINKKVSQMEMANIDFFKLALQIYFIFFLQSRY